MVYPLNLIKVERLIMKSNILKKFLRLTGIVWGAALTVMVFAVMLCKSEWIVELLSSTVLVAVLCLVIGGGVGFIAGTIVCYLNTAKAVEARDQKIDELKTECDALKKDLHQAHATATTYSKPASKKNSHILKEIEGLSLPSDEANHDLQEETLSEDTTFEESV